MLGYVLDCAIANENNRLNGWKSLRSLPEIYRIVNITFLTRFVDWLIQKENGLNNTMGAPLERMIQCCGRFVLMTTPEAEVRWQPHCAFAKWQVRLCNSQALPIVLPGRFRGHTRPQQPHCIAQGCRSRGNYALSSVFERSVNPISTGWADYANHYVPPRTFRPSYDPATKRR